MSSAANTEENQNIKNLDHGVTIGDVPSGIAHAVIAGGNVEQVHVGDKIYARSELEDIREYLKVAIATYALSQVKQNLNAQSIPIEPYKFLEWFDIENSNIFFGRDDTSQKLYQLVKRSRMTVLHAKSGAGKTSLLNAGLAPKLIQEGLLPVFFRRAYDNPISNLKRVIAAPSIGKWPKLLEDFTLSDVLRNED